MKKVNQVLGILLTATVAVGPAARPAEAAGPDGGLQCDSVVAGLSCLVVGHGATQSSDLVAYLANAGAHTRLVTDLAAAMQLAPALPVGLWVWIVNTEADAPISVDSLRAIARSNPGLDAR